MLFIHAAAVVATWITPLTWQVNMAVILLIVISLVSALHKHAFKIPLAMPVFGSPISHIVWDSEGDWQLIKLDGNITAASLLGTSYVNRQLLVLNFKIKARSWYSRYQTLVLLPDGVDSESFRRLCVRLRLVRNHLAESSPA